MSTKRRKRSKRVNLRIIYNAKGYKSDYSWFIRTKVIPIIGEGSLHPIRSKSKSKVKEYCVSSKNFLRVVKSLGLNAEELRMTQAVISAGPEVTAKTILELVKKTKQPDSSEEYPIRYRIPIHPISHNKMYSAKGNRIVRSPEFTEWRKKVFPLLTEIVKGDTKGIDFDEPVQVDFYFGHIEKVGGYSYDRTNFQKSAQDCIFEHFGYDDSLVHKSSIDGEFVDSVKEGFIEFSIRNI